MSVSKEHEKAFTQTVEVLNSLPNIEDKRYLELGIDAGWTFNNIKCKDKTGVDIKPEAKPDFLMTTDDFFAKNEYSFPVGDMFMFDLIYIDADHSAKAVMRDFNNSVECLKNNGLIFIHDLYPETENMTGPGFCGDGFKWLYKVRESLENKWINGFAIITCKENHGLTMIAGCQTAHFYWSQEELDAVTYKDFVCQQVKYRRMTQQEMCLQMVNIRDIIPEW